MGVKIFTLDHLMRGIHLKFERDQYLGRFQNI